MRLTQMEEERLLLFLAAELARKRRAAGLRLNHPEAVALICDEVMEAGRAGRSYDEATEIGYGVLDESDVLEGVADMVDRIQVEPLFEDGTKLVTLHFPISRAGTGRPGPGAVSNPDGPDDEILTPPDAPGSVQLEVANTLDRAIHVGSHFHFFEVNRALRFDRAAAYGMRLDIPAGLTVRFEAGETVTVRLRPLRGERIVTSFHGLVGGRLDDDATRSAAMERARAGGFLADPAAGGDL
jgi:urease subunit gamma/beta